MNPEDSTPVNSIRFGQDIPSFESLYLSGFGRFGNISNVYKTKKKENIKNKIERLSNDNVVAFKELKEAQPSKMISIDAFKDLYKKYPDIIASVIGRKLITEENFIYFLNNFTEVVIQTNVAHTSVASLANTFIKHCLVYGIKDDDKVTNFCQEIYNLYNDYYTKLENFDKMIGKKKETVKEDYINNRGSIFEQPF